MKYAVAKLCKEIETLKGQLTKIMKEQNILTRFPCILNDNSGEQHVVCDYSRVILLVQVQVFTIYF